MLWASLPRWTGSQQIPNRLEPVYHQALWWASGLTGFVSSRKLFLLARIPPSKAPSITRPQALHQALVCGSRPPATAVRPPPEQKGAVTLAQRDAAATIRRPLPHSSEAPIPLAKFLGAGDVRAGDILEDLMAPGPIPAPPFPVAILKAA